MTDTRLSAFLARQGGSCRLPPPGNPAPPPQGVAALSHGRGITGLRTAGGDTVTVYGPLSSQSQDNKGSRNIAPSGDSAPHTPRGGAVLRQTFGVRVRWTYCWSTLGPARHRAECTAPWLLSQGDRGRAPLSRELSSLRMPRCGSGEGVPAAPSPCCATSSRKLVKGARPYFAYPSQGNRGSCTFYRRFRLLHG